MPEQTLRAFADHGEVARTVDADPVAARETLAHARRAGIDLGAVTAEPEREGVQAFSDSYQQLIDCIEAKRTPDPGEQQQQQRRSLRFLVLVLLLLP